MKASHHPEPGWQQLEIERLQHRLEEAEETLRAIASGEVDALVIPGDEGDRIFSLAGAEQPYRDLVETMNQGAAVLATDGTILYANHQLGALLRVPLEALVGRAFPVFVAPADRPRLEARLTSQTWGGPAEALDLETGTGPVLPVLVSFSRPAEFGAARLNLVVTDLTEQKAIEQTRASERMARGILDSILGQVAVVDASGTILMVNEPWRQFARDRGGWDPALTGEGANYLEVLRQAVAGGEADAEGPLHGLEAVLRGARDAFETVYPCAFAEERFWFRMCVTRIEHGAQGAVILHEDITEQVKLEETHLFLAQARWGAGAGDLFQALVQFLAHQLGMDHVRLSCLSADGLSTETLAAWHDGRAVVEGPQSLRGTPEAEVQGRALLWHPNGLWERFPGDVRAQAMQAESFLGMSLWGSQGQPLGLLALTGRRAMADARVAEAILTVVAERAAGELERRQAEQATARAEVDLHKLSTALEQSPVAVMITNLQGMIEYVNPWFTTVTGYAYGEAVGRNPRFLQSGSMPVEAYQELWRSLTAGEIWHGEFHNRKKNGETFWERASIAPVRDAQGVITHFVAVKEDITERLSAERENTRLQAHLMQAQKMESLGSLSGGVAHDMNNVLGAILTLADLQVRSLPPEHEARRTFETILEAATRGGKLIKSLLNFARRHPEEERELDLNAILLEGVRILERTTLARVKLDLDLAPGLRPVLGDGSALGFSALLNSPGSALQKPTTVDLAAA